jgi:riboflavin kinase/FMN adenylyltransferase
MAEFGLDFQGGGGEQGGLFGQCKENVTVAIGVFDGLHLGHRAVFKQVFKNFRKTKDTAVVFSFTNNSIKKGSFIYDDKYKMQELYNFGFNNIFLVDFKNFKDYSPYDFTEKILINNINAKKIVIGENFKFGKNASGPAEHFRELGLNVVEVPFEEFDGERISSTRIKECLQKGEMVRANKMLGSEYTIFGVVRAGNRLGRTFDCPTANQYFQEGQLIPKRGVYLSQTIVDNVVYDSVTNIGIRPTITKENFNTAHTTDGSIVVAETHIKNFSANIYAETIAVKLKIFIRDEHKFPDKYYLINALLRDKMYS